MSNYSKLWLARIAFWVISTLDASAVVKVGTDAGSGGSLPLGWTIIAVLLTGLTIYFWLLTRHYKAHKNEESGMNLNDVEVQALAAYGADVIKRRQEQATSSEQPAKSKAMAPSNGSQAAKTTESAADHPQNLPQ